MMTEGNHGTVNDLYGIFNIEVRSWHDIIDVYFNIHTTHDIESFPLSSSFRKFICKHENGTMVKENEVFQNVVCSFVNPLKEFQSLGTCKCNLMNIEG
jgi:hypothetical protein